MLLLAHLLGKYFLYRLDLIHNLIESFSQNYFSLWPLMVTMTIFIGILKTLLSIYEPNIGGDKNAVCYTANGYCCLLYQSW